MEKTLQLNILPLTVAKRRKLRDTQISFKEIATASFAANKSANPRTYTQLHHIVYAKNRAKGIASQLVEEAQRYAWQRRRICECLNNPTVRFDKRLFSFKATGRGHAVLSVRATMRGLVCPYAKTEATDDSNTMWPMVGKPAAS